MFTADVMYDHKPMQVTVENLPDGTSRILLADNVREAEDNDGTYYLADVAYMVKRTDATPSATEISAGFSEWYKSASEWSPTAATAEDILMDLVAEQEERICMLEILN